MKNYTNHTIYYMDNAIEISWIHQELVNSGKLPDKYSMPYTAEYIKEVIIDIALEFEKEYGDSDWLEEDYLDTLTDFVTPRLIERL